jgi:hypothetical protein
MRRVHLPFCDRFWKDDAILTEQSAGILQSEADELIFAETQRHLNVPHCRDLSYNKVQSKFREVIDEMNPLFGQASSQAPGPHHETHPSSDPLSQPCLSNSIFLIGNAPSGA